VPEEHHQDRSYRDVRGDAAVSRKELRNPLLHTTE